MPKSRRRCRLDILLGHISGSDQRSRYPVNFCAQFITNAPDFELGDPLSAAFERADALLREGTGILAARLHEATIASALIATKQLRLGDLVTLDIDQHLVRHGGEGIRRIQTPRQEASSPLGIDIPLPEDLGARLTQHLPVFRPLLPGADRSTLLFLGSEDGALAINELRARLRLFGLAPHRTRIGESR